ncbi:MAG TPA: aspartate aminotransferase family protein, partial [Candidatus Marinimicrobia bacterium]|nr:aspartate aminotransferase family protein [Candidatus Neomarinimicrobiota bacterium]
MDRKEFDNYVLPTYKRFPITLVKGRGMQVWDDEGNEYLDFFPG